MNGLAVSNRRRNRLGGRAILTIAGVCALGCGGGSSQVVSPDGGADVATEAGTNILPGLSVALTADQAGIHPFVDSSGLSPHVALNYHVQVRNTGGTDLQDLRLLIPVPSGWAGTLTGGANSGPLGGVFEDIPWFPAGASAIEGDLRLTLTPTFFSKAADAIAGDQNVSLTAVVTQYDHVVASSQATAHAYLPGRLTTVKMSAMAAAVVQGAWLYASMTPAEGVHAGMGGIYKIALGDGTIVPVVQHALTAPDALPFALDGDTLWYATHATDVTTSVLMRMQIDGTGRVAVPLPTGTLNVLGVATDASNVFVAVEAADRSSLVCKLDKLNPAIAPVVSGPLGALLANTMGLSHDAVVVSTRSDGNIWWLDKLSMTVRLLASTLNISDQRTLACNDDTCDYVSSDGSLRSVAMVSSSPDGGVTTPATLATSASGRLLFDGPSVYLGSYGIFSIAPTSVPTRTVLLPPNAGGTFYPQAVDKSYVYFTVPDNAYFSGIPYFWKIHK
jgi:hypothetical protein